MPAPVRASDLSAGTGIPVHYLSKILRRLVLAGVLTSQKGQGGGFSLSRAPEEIPFADILAAVDVYPTLADLADTALPDHLDGVSLVPWLKNPEHPRERPATCSSGRDR